MTASRSIVPPRERLGAESLPAEYDLQLRSYWALLSRYQRLSVILCTKTRAIYSQRDSCYYPQPSESELRSSNLLSSAIYCATPSFRHWQP